MEKLVFFFGKIEKVISTIIQRVSIAMVTDFVGWSFGDETVH